MEKYGGKVSVAEASRRAGVAPAVIRRAIREGRLAAEPGPRNSLRVDPEAVARLAPREDTPRSRRTSGGAPKWVAEVLAILEEIRSGVERVQTTLENDRSSRLQAESRLMAVLDRIERGSSTRNGSSGEDAPRVRLVRTAYGWKPVS